MALNLPSINLVKNINLVLKIKNSKSINGQEIQEKLSRNNNLNNQVFSKKIIKNKISNSLDHVNTLKKVGLSSLLYRTPKSISVAKNSLKKNKNSIKINHVHNSAIFYRPLVRSSSVRLFPTGSTLKRLTISDNYDEIEKFMYYQKIEESKQYQDYILKEREYIPQESINNSFVESIDNTKENINKSSKKSCLYNRNSIYDILNPLNKRNTIKIKSKFKNQEQFEKFLIEKFISNHKDNDIIKNKKNRKICIILEGKIIINENDINGYFIEIPFSEEINNLTEKKRFLIYGNILKKCQNFFKNQKPLNTLFSPEKEMILDIKEIKDEYKYLYISHNIICKGISMVTTPNFLNIYKKEFKNYLKIENENNKKNNYEKICSNKKIYKFKIKRITKGIKSKYEKYKPHYSFANGEDEVKYEEFIIYSDNEERKEPAEKNILKNCYLKNDFFLYLNKKNTEKKISELKSKLKFNKPFDFRESYKKFSFNFDKLIEKYKKEIQRQLKINPRIYKIDQIDSKINSHNLKYPKDTIANLYLHRNNKKPFKRAQLKHDSFYYSADKKANKYYPPFILYNIPKLLSEFKNYTRRRLYEIYMQYKDLVVISYAKNKSDFILKSGVDFDTFWMCVEQLSTEKKKFVEKIYNQINRSKLCVLNMKDFLRGMYFIQNSEITEKLDLFLKALDVSGKGVITYKEAIEICKDSIQRNLSEKNQYNQNNLYALNELSQFFATFIFKLIGVGQNELLKLDDLKKAILQKNNEFNEIEYLEMFCGANN